MTAIATADHVLTIAQDMFSAMIDGEPGLVTWWGGESAIILEPVNAWVDVQSAEPVRALVTTERATAEHTTRALLGMEPEESVAGEDMQDAFGEIANVIGGNLKGLMPEGGTLTLPIVTSGPPGMPGTPAWECQLAWRAAPIVISMWHLPTDGKEPTP
mgnify:CR=1 FL=1